MEELVQIFDYKTSIIPVFSGLSPTETLMQI